MQNFKRQVEQTEKAKAEASRVYKLNLPTIKANEAIYEDNKKRIKRGWKTIKPTLELPHKLAKWASDILLKERMNKATLKLKTPETWLEEIEQLPSPVKERCACLIWWDYFGDKLKADRWPHLDKFLSVPFVLADEGEIAQGLHKCGYTPYAAKMRIMGIENI